MTREERAGLWIISIFVILAMTFYGMAILPGLSDFLGRESTAAATESVDGLPPEFAVVPKFGTLSARLLDGHSRTPMINPEVDVYGLTHIAEPDISLDPEGHLRITGLPVGRPFDLSLERLGYAPLILRKTLDSTDDLDLGEILMKRMVGLDGQVTDVFGRGIVGARVELHPPLPRWTDLDIDGDPNTRRANLGQLIQQNEVPLAETFTDRTGSFDFGQIQPSAFDIVVICPEFVTLVRRGVDLTREARRRFVDVQLESGISFEGMIASEDGEPIAGALILAVPVASDQPDSHAIHRRAASDAEGRFRFDQLAPGRWAFAASHPLIWPMDLGTLEIPHEARVFRVPSWKASETPFSEANPRPPNPRTLVSVLPDDSRALPQWNRTLSSLPESWPSPSRAILSHGNGAPRIPPDSPELSRTLLIRDSESESPVSRAALYASDEAFTNNLSFGRFGLLGQSQDRGELELRGSSGTPESWLILAPFYHPYTLYFPLEGDLDQVIEVALKKSTVRKVRVTTIDQRPIAYARVRAVPAGQDSFYRTLLRLMPRALEAETDENGIAELWTPHLASGWRLLVNDSRGHGVLWLNEAMFDEDVVKAGWEIELEPGAWIEGTVVGLDSGSFEGARVSISLPPRFSPNAWDKTLEDGSSTSLLAVVDPRGQFRIGPIPPLPDLEIEFRGPTIEGGSELVFESPVPPLEPGAKLFEFELDVSSSPKTDETNREDREADDEGTSEDESETEREGRERP